MSCKRVAEVVKVLKWKRRVVDFTAVAKKRSFRVLLLFGGDRRVEKLRILFLEKLLESFVRSQVDYKQLLRLAVSSC